ncbi:hypothetical protein [Saccharopolyspora spinosa]|uniref:Uncharacterized protein n=1 Tax=Saccharopolyspora spinosa TaxID=60894 RepID=A0A2N3Y6Q8_SACSN|nr:hypothetical protein [Saccharopolyspora spinosa]PKW18607.1 hypothetical protein A8926_6710 [Saccharopolyspora spinosa]
MALLTGERPSTRPRLSLDDMAAILGPDWTGGLDPVDVACQRLRDLLECAWPAVLATAGDPLEAITWRAALAVSTEPARIVDMGFDAFATAVRDELDE